MSTQPVLSLDVGSTFTKGVLVDAAGGALLATASAPTTLAPSGDGSLGFDARRAPSARTDRSVPVS